MMTMQGEQLARIEKLLARLEEHLAEIRRTHALRLAAPAPVAAPPPDPAPRQ